MAAEAEIDQARFERTTVDIKPLKASNVPIIFVIGGPGCGKGTQCERIVKRYGFTHLSTGDLLREEVESGSKRGQKMSAIMKKGELVPLDVVLDLLKEAMMKHLSKTKGYLIDGFPREIAQGVEFEKQIKPCTMVLFFDVSDKTMLERCLKRGQTSGRVDDNEDTIRKRLATFHGVSKPVVEFYKNKVKIVNAETTPSSVFENVTSLLDIDDSKKNLMSSVLQERRSRYKEKEEVSQHDAAESPDQNQPITNSIGDIASSKIRSPTPIGTAKDESPNSGEMITEEETSSLEMGESPLKSELGSATPASTNQSESNSPDSSKSDSPVKSQSNNPNKSQSNSPSSTKSPVKSPVKSPFGERSPNKDSAIAEDDAANVDENE